MLTHLLPMLPLTREMLERAAGMFARMKAGEIFDEKRRNHVRLAITALQMANTVAI